MNLVPEWTGLVISAPAKAGNAPVSRHSEFRNALLYCDKVFWYPTEYVTGLVLESLKVRIVEVLDGARRQQSSLERLRSMEHVLLTLNGRRERAEFSEVATEPSNVLDQRDHLKLPMALPLTPLEEVIELLNSALAAESQMSDTLTELRSAGLTPNFQLLLPEQSFYDQLRDGSRNKVGGFSFEIPQPDLIIVPPDSTERQPWETPLAVTRLSLTISQLYFPDVAQLPFVAIAEMRDRLSDYLNPMRAELLRLSEDLRKLAGDSDDVSRVEHEAEILIRVRIEPLIREAGQRVQEMMNRKWRRFFQGMAKVFGLTGAALFKPDLLKDALKEVLDTGAALNDREDTKEPLADTAHFVLEARRFMIERDAETP